MSYAEVVQQLTAAGVENIACCGRRIIDDSTVGTTRTVREEILLRFEMIVSGESKGEEHATTE